jgi:hypothetical protein
LDEPATSHSPQRYSHHLSHYGQYGLPSYNILPEVLPPSYPTTGNLFNEAAAASLSYWNRNNAHSSDPRMYGYNPSQIHGCYHPPLYGGTALDRTLPFGQDEFRPYQSQQNYDTFMGASAFPQDMQPPHQHTDRRHMSASTFPKEVQPPYQHNADRQQSAQRVNLHSYEGSRATYAFPSSDATCHKDEFDPSQVHGSHQSLDQSHLF